jgi:hypothetical protein
MPKVFSKCLKDGKEVNGILALSFDTDGQPLVAIDFAKAGAKTIAHALTINPQWLRKVESLDYEYVYDGVIILPKPQGN